MFLYHLGKDESEHKHQDKHKWTTVVTDTETLGRRSASFIRKPKIQIWKTFPGTLGVILDRTTSELAYKYSPHYQHCLNNS